jgi:hypothetical protein
LAIRDFRKVSQFGIRTKYIAEIHLLLLGGGGFLRVAEIWGVHPKSRSQIDLVILLGD